MSDVDTSRERIERLKSIGCADYLHMALLDRIDTLTAERDALKAAQIDAIRAALEAAAAIAEDAESGRCQRCGHPRNNHPYRHPFIGFASGDLPAAIRALDPAAIMAGASGGITSRSAWR